MSHLLHKALLALMCSTLLWCTAYSQCANSEPFIIPDDANSTLSLIIENVGLDDLSDPTQGVCAVNLNFSHGLVGDLSVELVSPDGQAVALVGPVGLFSNTQQIQWNVQFVACGNTPQPDIGIGDRWSNDEGFTNFSNYSGSYYPYQGCLEDFDQGSVNGIWTLRILDNDRFDFGEIESFSIEFCADNGLACQQCIADPEELTIPEMKMCLNDPDLILDLSQYATVPAGYTHQFAIVKDSIILNYTGSNIDLTEVEAGNYMICGLSYLTVQADDLPTETDYYLLKDMLNGAPPPLCAQVTDTCLTIQILPYQDTMMIDTLICGSDFFEFNGEQLASLGEYRRTIGDGCQSLVLIKSNRVELRADISALESTLTCEVDSILLSADNSDLTDRTDIQWVLENGSISGETQSENIYVEQAGTYWLILSEGPCQDSISVVIEQDEQSPEIGINSTVITCNSPISDLDINTTPMAQTYLWEAPDGMMFDEDDLDVSLAGIYKVIVTLPNGCTSTASHEVKQDTSTVVAILEAEAFTCNTTDVEIKITNYRDDLEYAWSGPSGIEIDSGLRVTMPGLYSVETRSSNGCSKTSAITIEDLSVRPRLTIEDFEIISCDITSVDLIVTSDLFANSFTWNGPNVQDFVGDTLTVSSPGTYTVLADTPTGCNSSEEALVIADDAIPSLTFEAPLITCEIREVDITTTPSTDDLSFIWTRNGEVFSTDQNPRVDDIGFYVVQATATNGCVILDSIEIGQTSDIPNINFEYGEINCINDQTQITIGPINSNYNYIWRDPQGNPLEDLEPVIATGGIYVLEVEDPTLPGCGKNFPVNIVETYSPPQVTINEVPSITCRNPELQLVPIFSDPDLIFEWTGTDYLSNETIARITKAGFYTLTATGSNGCPTTSTFEIRDDSDRPIITAEDVEVNSCISEINLNASTLRTDDLIEWSGPNAYEAVGESVVALDAGTYKVKVTAHTGCVDSTEVMLTINNTLPQISFAPSNILSCENPSTSLSASVDVLGSALSWITPSLDTLTGESIVTTEGGEHIVIAVAPDGCRALDTINVISTTNFPDLTVSSDTLECGDLAGQISFETDDSFVGVLWIGPDGREYSTQTLEVLDAGMYSLQVTSLEGCTSVDSAFLSKEEGIPDVEFVVGDLSCESISTNLTYINNDTANPGLYSVEWSGPGGQSSTDSIFTVNGPGIYAAKVTNIATGCSLNKEYNLTEDSNRPSIAVEDGVISCGEGKINLNLRILSSIENPRIEWTGPNGYTAFEANPVAVDSGLYRVIVYDDNGCSTVAEVKVSEDRTEPFIFVDDTALDCDQNPVAINAETSDPNANFEWYGPNNFFSTEIGPLVTEEGEYFVFIEGSNGCIYIDTSEVSIVAVPPVFQAIGDTINCLQTEAALKVEGVQDDLSFEWTGVNFSSRELSPVIGGTGFFTLTVTGQNGCTAQQVVEVVQDEEGPTALASSPDPIICTQSVVELDGTGSSMGSRYKYAWSTIEGEIVDGTNQLNPKVSAVGEYILLVTDEMNGCTNTASTTVLERPNDLTSFVFSSLDPSCKDITNGSIEVSEILGGVGPYTYAIGSGPFENSSLIEDLGGGTYIVTVKDDFGCEISQTISLAEGPELVVELEDEYEIYLGDTIEIESNIINSGDDISSIEWQLTNQVIAFDTESVVISPADFSEIRILVETESGCFAQANSFISVNRDRDAYMANIFNPNSFGENAVYRVYTSKAVEEIISFNVYDRWGNRVYNAENYFPEDTSIAWDGTHLGQNVLPAVYVYMVELLMIDGSKRQLSGDLTLIR